MEEQSKGEHRQDSPNTFQESRMCSVGFSLYSHLKTGGAFIVTTHQLENSDSIFRCSSQDLCIYKKLQKFGESDICVLIPAPWN